jgi:D-3-phosphoglycerate dehydrogenase
MRLRVVITDCDLGDPAAEVSLLRERLDAEVVVAACRTADDVLAASRDADALLVQWAPVTREVIAQLNRCQAISRYGIGLDMVDLDAAEERGVTVYNVPHYCTEEVATHTVAMLLALFRRLPQLDASVRNGQWDAPGVLRGRGRLSDATLGLVGLGRIGRLVAAPFLAMGTRVVAYDPGIDGRAVAVETATGAGRIELTSLTEVAERSNLISLHCPLTADTAHVVGADFLRRVQPGTVLVNTARGGLIDIDALSCALQDDRIQAAGLDVFADEPLPADAPIRELDRVLLSPHAAWCSDAALPALKHEAANNLVRHFERVAARP